MHLQTVNPSIAIKKAIEQLRHYGQKVPSKYWQSTKGDFDTWELFDYNIEFNIPPEDELAQEIQPNLPWADEHFAERVSGIPYNPPPSHVNWPWNRNKNQDHMSLGIFSHTYPERIWPPEIRGLRYTYGDLNDVVTLLKEDQTTRQAFLPIWYPEDTGAANGNRVPCTLGYLFMQRHGFFHMIYYIRSCDIVRHFQDDIYLSLKLYYWVKNQLPKTLSGKFSMKIASLHCFDSDRAYLPKIWKG